MEPVLVTPPELQPILAELSALETTFHWPSAQTTRAALKKMTADGFWEVGASGRRYCREFVLGELERRRDSAEPDVWKITDFHCRKLAGDVYLLTYTLLQFETRLTRRSSIWQKTAEGWECVYHQGTVVQNS
ncbi:MAG: DUF4440 domain-containing protein [Terracidiphilus sp.]|nr:DUF4440 domain-containing protein [Terracidiphilus sp.]